VHSGMEFLAETVTDGVRERVFALGEVPGVLWTPARASGPRPLVLLGHGGGQHKTEWGVTSRALPLVRDHGFAAVAIDAPGTGERPAHPEVLRLVATIERRTAAGDRAAAEWRELCDVVAAELIDDWQRTLDSLCRLPDVGDSHGIGYHGLSQGGEMGLRLVAAEARIRVAVLGLIGSDWLVEPAARIDVPVRFVVQWDDEAEPRDAALRLFGALGSSEKSLHANAGGHHEVPLTEIDSAVRFLVRHLTQVPHATDDDDARHSAEGIPGVVVAGGSGGHADSPA
jgi:pimeloyl-ACP methyl ester carboxylesterase